MSTVWCQVGAIGCRPCHDESDHRSGRCCRGRKYRPAEPFGEPVPQSHWARLRQGININNWFCQPWNIQIHRKGGGFNAEILRASIAEHDRKLIRGAGFDLIRLPVVPVFRMDLQTEE